MYTFAISKTYAGWMLTCVFPIGCGEDSGCLLMIHSTPSRRPFYTTEAVDEARVLNVNLVPPGRSTHVRVKKRAQVRSRLPTFWVVFTLLVMAVWEFFATAQKGPLSGLLHVKRWLQWGSIRILESGFVIPGPQCHWFVLGFSSSRDGLRGGDTFSGSLLVWDHRVIKWEQPCQSMFAYKLLHILLLLGETHSWRPSGELRASSPLNNFIETRFPPLNTFLPNIPRLLSSSCPET